MTTTMPAPGRTRADRTARPGPAGRLAGLAFRRKGTVLLAWLAALLVVLGLSAAFGDDFAIDYSVSGSDSQRAQRLLAERFPQRAGDAVDLVVHAPGGVTDPAVRRDVNGLVAELGGLPHVVDVDDPYAAPGGVSPDGNTLLARITLDVAQAEQMPVEDTRRLIEVAEDAERSGMSVVLGGRAVRLAEAGEFGSEAVGLLAAAVILLLMFGSVVAAGLPIGTALGGLAVSGASVGLLAALVDVPDWAPYLGTMLGIALGIDYALLMVTRFREWRAAGLDPAAATVATVDTAGRAVLVAGGTVMVSMLGLLAMGLSFMTGTAVVAIAAVLVVMAAAMTLFPALLGYTGRWVDRLRIPGTRRRIEFTPDGQLAPARGWTWWNGLVRRFRVPAVVAGVGLLLALALPFLDARYGLPDAGSDPAGSSARQAYDRVADGFGAGANGPLLVAADLSGVDGQAAASRLESALAGTPGVAAVAPPQVSAGGDAALLMVVPTTGPQEAETEQLVRTLREDVIPAATAGGATAYVGGVTAVTIDMNTDLAGRLPLLIGGVVLVSMLLLTVAFRSVVIPLTAAVLNLLSVVAAYGVVALVLQGGWIGGLVGIDTATPMAAYVPVMMFAILFGLSMDYEVFLISRMRESWVATGDNRRAVRDGLAGTGRVITAAAAIMVAVFAAFVPAADVAVKALAIGMAAAIFVDATIVRMLLVPAVMHLLGRANWWAPEAMLRRLPQLHVEGRPEAHLPSPNPIR